MVKLSLINKEIIMAQAQKEKHRAKKYRYESDSEDEGLIKEEKQKMERKEPTSYSKKNTSRLGIFYHDYIKPKAAVEREYNLEKQGAAYTHSERMQQEKHRHREKMIGDDIRLTEEENRGKHFDVLKLQSEEKIEGRKVELGRQGILKSGMQLIESQLSSNKRSLENFTTLELQRRQPTVPGWVPVAFGLIGGGMMIFGDRPTQIAGGMMVLVAVGFFGYEHRRKYNHDTEGQKPYQEFSDKLNCEIQNFAYSVLQGTKKEDEDHDEGNSNTCQPGSNS